jgi:ferredoxin
MTDGSSEMKRKLTVRVEHDLCIGNAMCRLAAPKAFVADAEGQSVVADPEAESFESLMDAVASCPTGAVVVEDAETGEVLEP